MRFTSEVYLIDFDMDGYLSKLDSHMVETTKEAARKWLRTVVRLIPIWSRASIATFNELSEAVGFPINLGTNISFKDRLSLGLSTSSGGLKVDKFKSYHFFYQTDLRYLAWNEFHKAVKGDGSGWFSSHRDGPGPYRFQDAGAREFESFSQEVMLPNPTSFISGRKL